MIRPLGLNVSNVDMQKFSLYFSLSLFFSLLMWKGRIYSISMNFVCVEVVVFVWKWELVSMASGCYTSLWWLSSLILNSVSVFPMYCILHLMHSSKLLQFKLWWILNILFVRLFLKVVVFMTCLQYKILLLAKQGVHLPCMLFVDFLLALPFLFNLVPIMSLRFEFRGTAKIGGFWSVSARFGFMCRRCQCFITISFILGSVMLYLSHKGMVVAIFFFFFQKLFSLL